MTEPTVEPGFDWESVDDDHATSNGRDPGQDPFAPAEEPPAPFSASLNDFLALDLQSPPPLLGTDDDTIIPTGGLVVVAGMPGAGKTTLILDAVFHFASGEDWLEFPVPRPLNILLIENEGPQHKFQEKLRKKLAAWKHPLGGQIRVQTWKWGEFTIRNVENATRLREDLDQHQIDIVVGDPLDTLGTEGVGSPENTSEFLRMLVPLGLTQNRTFIFLHHFRKEISVNEINQVSGAWGQRLDTLLVLRTTDQPDELRLSLPKLRWGDDAHTDKPLILGKIRNTQGFELLRVETHEPEPSEDAVEAMLRKAVGILTKRGGALERQILAMHCETEVGNRTFTKALSAGRSRELLATDKDGRKTLYSLAPGAYL